MKVALVHDYLNDFGGAERVLLSLSEIYSNAPIYTLFCRDGSPAHRSFAGKKIVQSWFSSVPFAYKLISPLRFLIPFMWSRFDFSKYDLVITSASWAVTKGMKKGKKTTEICYLHTPPRYLYGYDASRNWQNKWFSGVVKVYAQVVNHFMRMYDFKQAQKVDYYIVNSQNVGKRLEKYYRRDVDSVIYPPVDLHINDTEKQDYYFTGGRLVAAKNFDLIIKAFNQLNYPLKVFGTGVEERTLKSIADRNIEFVGRVSDEELTSLYSGAKALIVAQKDEDFGITPVEAAAAGTPTIAYKAEGYLETVVEGKTGVFFEELTVKSLVQSVKRFEKVKFDRSVLQKHAVKFSEERFKKEIREFVASKLKTKAVV
jgi:glycosyltransferase involved in cell wall biosynthesis